MHVDDLRYYKTPTNKKLISITTVISNYKKEFFNEWRKRVGLEEAEKITKRSTSRGTDFHTLVENYLYNRDLPKVQELSEFLFEVAQPELDRINNIRTLEGSLYSEVLGIAGTVDCISNFDDELAIVDFKTSAKPKPRQWIEGYFVQCAAYAAMLYELTGISVKKFVIIMACENGECVVYQERDKGRFIKLLITYIEKFLQDRLGA
jgi:genome maintenance exonuclease 1